MYIDFHGYEIEDAEMDGMIEDAKESAMHYDRFGVAPDPDSFDPNNVDPEPDGVTLDSILYNGGVAQAEENGLVYIVRDTLLDYEDALYSYTLYIAKGAMPPHETKEFEFTDDILAAYPDLHWVAVEMEV